MRELFGFLRRVFLLLLFFLCIYLGFQPGALENLAKRFRLIPVVPEVKWKVSNGVLLYYSEFTKMYLGRRYEREYNQAVSVLKELGYTVHRVNYKTVANVLKDFEGVLIVADARCIPITALEAIRDYIESGGRAVILYQSFLYDTAYQRKERRYKIIANSLGVDDAQFSKNDQQKVLILDKSATPFNFRELPAKIHLKRGYRIKLKLRNAQVIAYWEDMSPAITLAQDGKVILCSENLLVIENWSNPEVKKLLMALIGYLTGMDRDELKAKIRELKFTYPLPSDLINPTVKLIPPREGPEISVLLNSLNWKHIREIYITCTGRCELQGDSKTITSNGWIRLSARGGKVCVELINPENNESHSQNLYFSSLKISPVDSQHILVMFTLDEHLGLEYYSYRLNILDIWGTGNSLRFAVRLPIEWYLAGVVPVEMPPSWALEALKAQAVAARTYTLRHLKRHGEYDLCDMPHCQAYGGEKVETYRTTLAVLHTKGEVLTFNGDLINAVYHSTCGGHTASAYEVWHADIPYLTGVSDTDNNGEAFCRASPLFSWQVSFGSEELQKRLKNNLPRLTGRYLQGKVLELKVTSRGKSGRPTTVLIRTDKTEYRVHGDDIPYLFSEDGYFPGIPSNFITNLKWIGDILIIEGRGYGHGVGMCQWGAYGMALKGYNYKQILRHYYRGVKLKHIY